MATSPPARDSQSVFKALGALGSYADRIKSPNGAANSKTLPNIASAAPSSSASSSNNRIKTAPPPPPPAAEVDDGPWQTVGGPKAKAKTDRQDERKGGSSSRDNWRERPARQDKTDQEERRPTTGKPSKKGASSSLPPPVEKTPAPRRVTAVSAAGTPTSVWGTPLPRHQTSQSTPASVAPTAVQTPRTVQSHSQTVPSSPSLNGTTVTANSVPPSIGSPNMYAETASDSTASASVTTKNDEDENDWRTKTKEVQPSSKPAASLPPVNPWSIKQIAQIPPPVKTEPASESGAAVNSSSPSIQFGSVGPKSSLEPSLQPTLPNGRATEEGGKGAGKTKKGPKTVAPPTDPTSWPDVKQAAEVIKVTEEKKDKIPKKETEDVPVLEEGSGANIGKKTKWTPIPATELLAAADEAAEANRRQAAARKRAARAEMSTSPTRGGKARKPTDRSVRTVRAGSNEIRLPPNVSQTQRANGFKPTFGSIRPASESGSSALQVTDDGAQAEASTSSGGVPSAPLSRQNSSQSRRNSSSKASQAQSTGMPSEFNGSIPVTASHTAPIAQNPQFMGMVGQMPRLPRGRDFRVPFPNRGRGGAYRAGSVPHKFTSPTNGFVPLPGQEGFAGMNLYQRGYGMGFPGGYYMPGPGMYDPMQAYGRQGVTVPPPPMPQTFVQGLDSLRFYLLGQVEYYFSLQNLAMDFFLRQQMDSEGWIDISTIASFNRVKSLTLDQALVKEMMSLSSLLEVREEKVRLAQASKKWVLPDAKPSSFEPSPTSPEPPAGDQHKVADDMGMTMMNMGVGMGMGVGEHPFGEEIERKYEYEPGGVHGALMKSASSSTTVQPLPSTSSETTWTAEGTEADESMEKSEDGSKVDGMTETPATSMSGDTKDGQEVELH